MSAIVFVYDNCNTDTGILFFYKKGCLTADIIDGDVLLIRQFNYFSVFSYIRTFIARKYTIPSL